MKSGYKLWSTVVDYFLILGAIIGVGFASGKEICVFFFDFGGASLIGLFAFGLLYIYLFFVIQHISNKLKINSYDKFNAKMFGKLYKITNVVMLINFVITSAGMLAGADYLFETFFDFGYKIPSIILSVITFVLLIGGIEKIKFMSPHPKDFTLVNKSIRKSICNKGSPPETVTPSIYLVYLDISSTRESVVYIVPASHIQVSGL